MLRATHHFSLEHKSPTQDRESPVCGIVCALPRSLILGKAATTIRGRTTSRTRSCSGVGDDVSPFAKRLELFRLSTKEDILSRVRAFSSFFDIPVNARRPKA